MIEVIVRLDDQVVAQAVDNREGARVRRFARFARSNDPRAGDEPAIFCLNQLIEADLDWSDEIDQSLHVGESRVTAFVDTGVGPSRPSR